MGVAQVAPRPLTAGAARLQDPLRVRVHRGVLRHVAPAEALQGACPVPVLQLLAGPARLGVRCGAPFERPPRSLRAQLAASAGETAFLRPARTAAVQVVRPPGAAAPDDFALRPRTDRSAGQPDVEITRTKRAPQQIPQKQSGLMSGMKSRLTDEICIRCFRTSCAGWRTCRMTLKWRSVHRHTPASIGAEVHLT